MKYIHNVIFFTVVLEGKRKRTSNSANSSLNSRDSSSQFSSSVESETESNEKHKHHKHKRHTKSKRSKKKRRESRKEKNTDDLSFKQRYFLSYITTALSCISKYKFKYWFERLSGSLHNKILFCIVSCCCCSRSSVERQMLEGENEMEGEREHGGKREKPVVRPEEIPPVPENRFLLRRDMPSQEDKVEMSVLSWASFMQCF